MSNGDSEKRLSNRNPHRLIPPLGRSQEMKGVTGNKLFHLFALLILEAFQALLIISVPSFVPN